MALQSQLFAGDPVLEAVAANTARVSTEQNPVGAHVEKLQVSLLDRDPGCLPGFGMDARYGIETADAVFRFKTEVLGIAPGQVVRDIGPQTIGRLDGMQLELDFTRPQPREVPPEALAAKLAYDPFLLQLPGVTGTAIGLREEGGTAVDVMEVSVYLATDADFPEGIPEEIGGLPVSVEWADFEPCGMPPDDDDITPLKGGVCIGAFGTGKGTMGAIVRDRDTGELLGLSCQHVTGDPTTGIASGDVVWQPPPAAFVHSLQLNADALGPVRRAEAPRPNPLIAGAIVSDMDASVFALHRNDGMPVRRHGPAIAGHDSSRSPDLVPSISGTQPPIAGQMVRKRGRTTGLTRGVVLKVGLSLLWDQKHKPNHFLVNQALVIGLPSGSSSLFCDTGDSGAVVLDQFARTGVGLLWGQNHGGRYGMVTPLPTVELRLRVDAAWSP